MGNVGLLRPFVHGLEDGLLGHWPDRDPAALVDRAEQRTRRVAALGQPIRQRLRRARSDDPRFLQTA